jgi:hypothetical protein
MRTSNFALRLQPSLPEELRSVSDLEGVAMNQLINVAIAEQPAQMRTARWFADRIATADRKAGAQLIRDLGRGGGEKPRKGDLIARMPRKRRPNSTADRMDLATLRQLTTTRSRADFRARIGFGADDLQKFGLSDLVEGRKLRGDWSLVEAAPSNARRSAGCSPESATARAAPEPRVSLRTARTSPFQEPA